MNVIRLGWTVLVGVSLAGIAVAAPADERSGAERLRSRTGTRDHTDHAPGNTSISVRSLRPSGEQLRHGRNDGHRRTRIRHRSLRARHVPGEYPVRDDRMRRTRPAAHSSSIRNCSSRTERCGSAIALRNVWQGSDGQVPVGPALPSHASQRRWVHDSGRQHPGRPVQCGQPAGDGAESCCARCQPGRHASRGRQDGSLP